MATLTLSQIEDARIVILENARALVEEAKLLDDAGCHARAFALSQLATEEIAKLPMLVRAGLELDAGRTVSWQTLNRRLSNHKSKISLSVWIDYMSSGNHPSDDAEFMRVRAERRKRLDRKRNEALYAHLHEKSYRRPSDAIRPAEARGALDRARQHLEFAMNLERDSLGRIRGSGRSFDEFIRMLKNLDPEPAA